MLLPLLLNLNQFNIRDTHDGKGIYYQNQSKKKRRNHTQELFDALEASIRTTVLGEPEPDTSVVVRPTAVPSVTATHYHVALTKLIALAADYADLSARVDRLQRDLVGYEAKRLEEEEEDEFLMLL